MNDLLKWTEVIGLYRKDKKNKGININDETKRENNDVRKQRNGERKGRIKERKRKRNKVNEKVRT